MGLAAPGVAGTPILVVSLPTGPAAVDKAKAIAKLALSRL
jgi:hypothetical protein